MRAPTITAAIASSVMVVGALGACNPVDPLTPAEGAPQALAPPRPADCTSVRAATRLQTVVDGTPEGGALCLEPGAYPGSFRITKSLTGEGGLAANNLDDGAFRGALYAGIGYLF